LGEGALRGYDRGPLPSSIYTLIWRRTLWLQIAVLAIGLTVPALSVAQLEIQRRVVDVAIPEGDGDLLLYLGLAFAAALAVQALIKFTIYYLRGLIEAKVTRILRQRVLDAEVHRTPEAARDAVGPVTAIVAEEAYPLGGFAAQAINTPLVEGGALVGVFGFMLYSEPILAAIGLGVMAMQAVLVPIVQHWINLMSARRVNAVRRAAGDILAATAHAPGARWAQALREVRLAYRLRLRMNVFKAALKAFLKFTEKGAVLAVLIVGGAMVIAGETTLGVVMAFISGLKQVQNPWDEILTFYRSFADALIKYRLIRVALGPEIRIAPDDDPGPAVAIQLP
jgi:ABC-type bacteriocin/lantibiotic exporter with double-glycine peptidase domain